MGILGSCESGDKELRGKERPGQQPAAFCSVKSLLLQPVGWPEPALSEPWVSWLRIRKALPWLLAPGRAGSGCS